MHEPPLGRFVPSLVLALSFSTVAAATPLDANDEPAAATVDLATLGSNGSPSRGVDRGGPLGASAVPNLAFGFLENRGQFDSTAAFIGTSGPARVYVERDAVTLAVRPGDDGTTPPVTRFVFEGARDSARVEGAVPMPGTFNFYSGRRAGAQGLVRYSQVLLRDVYDGVDVRLRDHEGHLEYDVLLAPGAALDRVVVRCEGVERLELAEDGRLHLHTADGQVLTQSAPTTWAELPDGATRPLECRYVLLGDDRYGYTLADRSEGLPVVIDPGLEWSTFFGDSLYEEIYAVAQHASGNLVVAGTSESGGWALPIAGSPYPTHALGLDAYVAILDPTATGTAQVVWWTYLGGSFDDWIWAAETNAAGEIFVVGDTQSDDFPVTPNAYQTTHSSDWDAFVAQLDPATGTLVHSTYFGGTSWDVGQRILVEEPSIVTIAGGTESFDLPTTASAFDSSLGGNRDAYVARFDLSQSGAASLLYSTFVGGNGQDAWVSERQLDITHAPGGNITLVTSSFSGDFPVTPNAYRGFLSGAQDPVIAELDPSVPGPAGLVYGSYLGHSQGEGVSQVEVSPNGGYIITGFTYSAFFQTTAGAPFRTFAGPAGRNDAWVLHFDRAQANPWRYATLIPGQGFEGFNQIRVGSDGTVFGVGFTGANALVDALMPLTCNAFDKNFEGQVEAFVLALDPGGNGEDDVRYLSYLGGDGIDNVYDLVVESNGSTPVLRLGGNSNSNTLPVTPGAYQSATNGGFDGIAVQLRLNPYLTCVGNPNSAGPGGARLCALGPIALTTNQMQLSVTGLPPQSLGYFLMSTTEVAPFALPAPSQGSLCLGGTIVRFAGFVQLADLSGMVSFGPNLQAIPPPGLPLNPGDTAIFQYWFRDAGGTSNTSNGVAVTFD